jgi:hypothetical protein
MCLLLLIQYDLFVINLVLRLLRNEYPEYSDAAGVNIRALEGSVAAAALVGAIIGQLVAGKELLLLLIMAGCRWFHH